MDKSSQAWGVCRSSIADRLLLDCNAADHSSHYLKSALISKIAQRLSATHDPPAVYFHLYVHDVHAPELAVPVMPNSSALCHAAL